ncbi:MAG TPA: PIG-L family deacetylase [Fluviicola sp.]|nr:PIG-L family deacetylase [Fluviicola sp.]
MLELLKNKRVMVVVAHPDDELLGLGATMNRLIHSDTGIVTHVVILGEGITSRAENRDPKLWEKQLEIHRSNIYAAQKHIGYHSVSIHDFPDNRFDSVDLLDLIKVVEREKKAFQPEVIFTHHGGDVNIDHQRTFEAVITACRPMQEEHVKTIITFETPSGTEWRAPSDPRHFLPTIFCKVEQQHLEAKINGMECYEFERKTYPHPRSPEALKIQAQRWGVAIGADYAEAFQLIRFID